MDSLILCKFLRGVFGDFYAEAAEMLAAVTGWRMTKYELATLAQRVVNARKCLNEREGWTRAEDTLPDRLLVPPESTSAAPGLSRQRLDTMIAAYYQERGWDPDGRVPSDLRRELGLDDRAFGGG
jgi:aldehyde:ferredoxin oxidoreductase